MKVSIIIPVYNVSAYIEGCLKSVMGQTYDCIECIIVDDATPDDSIEKCEKMITTYHGPIQFSILHHEHNRGLSATRNTGTDAATGDYIFYLDSDDELTPDCIEKLTSPVIIDSRIEMVIGNYAIRSYDGVVTPSDQRIMQGKEKHLMSSEEIRDCYLGKKDFYGYAWNKLIRKDILARNQIKFKEGQLFEDNLWTFYLMKFLCNLYVIPDVTYIYNIRPGSITTNSSRKKFSYHMGLVYVEISKNFTIEDTKREAKRYAKPFCYCYIDEYNNPVFHQAARQYFKVSAANFCIKECLLIITTVCLSTFAWGRKFLLYVTNKLV